MALDSWARTLASVLLRSIAGDEGTALAMGDASASECASLAAMTEHPASTHARTLALVALYRSGDHLGVAELLSELSGPEQAAVTIVSLIQFVSRLLDEAPEDGDVWLRDALGHLAQVEGEKSIE